MEKKKDIIDLVEIYKLLKAKKKVFFMVLPIIFALSCLWIFPEPRYYKSNVVLAPDERRRCSWWISISCFSVWCQPIRIVK